MERRRAVVAALCDALFPSLPDDAQLARKAGKDSIAVMLETSGRSAEFIVDEVLRRVQRLAPEVQKDLALLFGLLSSGAGTAAVGGPGMLIPTCPPFQSFAQLPLRRREAILQYWASSPIPLLRKAFKGIKSLICSTIFSATDGKGGNPLWPAIGYTGSDPDRPAEPLPARKEAEEALQGAVLSLCDPGCKSARQLADMLADHGLEAACTADGAVEVACDVVVIGSGAGGGVAAALLAAAGAKVVVLEKGGFTPAAELPLREDAGFAEMYELGSLMTTQDAGMNILAGSTLGGGTRVNWQASFRTPPHVRQEWAREHGLPVIASEKYDRALDAVCARIGVKTGIKQHSIPNEKLAAGLTSLGWHCDEIPRNASNEHGCGHCCFGCPSGDKQDATGTWLADAARTGNAKILTGVFAERVLLEKVGGERRNAARGVAARTTSSAGAGGLTWRLALRAGTVVCSAGALHSPALLLRSKIKVNGNVGRNLRLHPATAVTGGFVEGFTGEKLAQPGPRVPRHTVVPPLPAVEPGWDGRTERPEAIVSWRGSIFSIFSAQHADWQGAGYGPLLETPSAHPGLMAASTPWLGGQDYKRLCAWLPYVSTVLVLVRDRGSGRVKLGKDGLPRLHYWPDAHDRASMLAGMEAGLRVLAAAGSVMLGTVQGGAREVTRFEPHRDDAGNILDPDALEAFLAGVRKLGVQKNGTTVFSAHQMGTCRMGASPKTSVCDARGECWHAQGLYMADASLFPTSTGVNPMVTVEALAYMVAEGLADGFRARAGKAAPAAAVRADVDPAMTRPEE